MPGAAVERAEPDVARLRVVVARPVVDDGQPQQVAVERDRPLGVAADRGHVVQPAELHALLLARHRARSLAARAGRRAAARRTPAARTAPPAIGPRAHGAPRRRTRRRRRSARPAPPRAAARARRGRRSARAARSPGPPSEASAMPRDEQHRAALAAADEAPDEQHEADEHAQLDERERVPRRARALGPGGRRRGARRCGRARRGTRGDGSDRRACGSACPSGSPALTGSRRELDVPPARRACRSGPAAGAPASGGSPARRARRSSRAPSGARRGARASRRAAPRPAGRAQRGDARRRARRGCASSSPSPSSRGPARAEAERARPGPARAAGRRRRRAQASSRSSRAIWSRRSRRAAASSATATAAGGVGGDGDGGGGHRAPSPEDATPQRRSVLRWSRDRAGWPYCGRAPQRPDRHGRPVHRPAPRHGAGALPDAARARRPAPAARRQRARRRWCSALEALAGPQRCGGRSRSAGCGSARRSTTAPTA